VTSPYGPMLVIANPRAGKGKVGRRLPEIERTLTEKGLDHRVVTTDGPGDATRAARRALEDGVRFLVAVGGDGTVHEVVNGMLVEDRPVAEGEILGVIAAGSGCDFVKTFGLPDDATKACDHLEGAGTYSIDVGRISYAGPDGSQTVRYFPNVAEVGLGGSVCERTERLPRSLGRSRYFLGFWLTLPRFRPGEVRVEAGESVYQGRAHNVVVANCQYFGGGMRISPRSWPGDGLLDVIVMTGPKSDAFTTLPRVYRGEHLPHPNMREMKSRRIRVEADRPYRIEADGEVLGTTPAAFDLIRQPIAVKI
jgi:diacylglycerol kinase (ATP)